MTEDNLIADELWDETAKWSKGFNGPDLIVSSGETITLAGGRSYQLGSVTIEAGGTLEFDYQERKWTLIRVTGPFVLEGKIIVGQMPAFLGAETDVVEETAPDGTLLRHIFRYSLGGRGGDGGGVPNTKAPAPPVPTDMAEVVAVALPWKDAAMVRPPYEETMPLAS